jgi:hypothetical protein
MREIDVFIPPNTNRFHANHLFKQLVDKNLEYNMYYDLGNDKPYPMFDVTMKDAFYRFCMNNTYKNLARYRFNI